MCVRVTPGQRLRETDVVKEVYLCDTLISLPAAKSHSAGGVSLNLKGLMGLIKERELSIVRWTCTLP